MRALTRAVAFDPEGWTSARRAQVAHLFDTLAPDWHTRSGPGRLHPLRDALDRGLAQAPAGGRRTCLDVGAGIGLFSEPLLDRFDLVCSVDLSLEMLRHNTDERVARLNADASRLPVADGSVDVLVLANCFLFGPEAVRALAPAGVVVWVSSRGTDTPIHLTADEVDEVLRTSDPAGEWTGVESAAGWGTWSVHWRGWETGPMKWPDIVTDALRLLEAEGYDAEFDLLDGDLCVVGTPVCKIHEVDVERLFRFEGPSDPGDEMVVFGLHHVASGVRGTFASGFGSAADPDLLDHLVGLTTRHRGN